MRRRHAAWPALLLLLVACGGDTPSTPATTDTSVASDTSDPCEDVDAESGEYVPGCEPACTVDDECDDGDVCTSDVCDPDVGCTHEVMEVCCTDDQCEIDGTCYDNREAHPEAPCLACSPLVSRHDWSPDDTLSCDDDNACTSDDRCLEGACVGTARVCEDGDVCTDDACDPATGECTSSFNAAPCDDGDLCTTGDVCDAGSCVGAGTRDCDDGNGCTVDGCDPDLGCTWAPQDGEVCDDGSLCTEGDLCTDGVCGGSDVDCDDNNLCTAEYCDPATGCAHQDLLSHCEDTNPCTDEMCDPEQGCVYPFNTDPCDDGNLCTVVDTCADGLCLGAPLDVDDGNVCTFDSCDPAIGAVYENNTLDCDDDNACTVGDVCADGGCVPGETPLDCDDDNVCTDDDCDPSDGCTYTNNVDTCDDGDMCTVSDLCGDGTCTGVERDCDDGNACTIDGCNAETGCTNTLIVSSTCRPEIVVSYPPRAATIEGPLPALIEITGTVTDGAGPITTFTLNGADAVLVEESTDPWVYSFSLPYNPQVGANTLEFLARDDFGTNRNRVQSFHWSTDYALASFEDPTSGFVVPGLGIWLGQATIDDGAPPPPTDLAAIFEIFLSDYDLSSFFSSGEAIASSGGFDIYLTSLGFDGTDVELTATDAGLRLNASLNAIAGTLDFICDGSFTCWIAGGDDTGGLSIESIDFTADLAISARPDHTLEVRVVSVNTSINNLEIWSDNAWTNFLLGIVEVFIGDSLVTDLEASLNTALVDVLGPTLEDALGALAFNMDFSLPRLDGATDPDTGEEITIDVSLASDFHEVDFEDADPGPQGGEMALRARSSAANGLPDTSPFVDNLGVPLRIGCGLAPQQLVIPKIAPIEIVFADDTLNEILRAAWSGGLIQFPVGEELLGGTDLSAFGVVIHSMDVSGWLPPLASDCGPDGNLKLYIGDMRIDAQLELFGQPMTLVVYVGFEAPIRLQAVEGELAIIIEDIENVLLEVHVEEEAMLASEAVVADLLRDQLVPMLGGLLGGGEPLASFPLPEIDLSESMGMAPGTLMIAIDPIDDPALETRIEGNTIVYGALR